MPFNERRESQRLKLMINFPHPQPSKNALALAEAIEASMTGGNKTALRLNWGEVSEAQHLQFGVFVRKLEASTARVAYDSSIQGMTLVWQQKLCSSS